MKKVLLAIGLVIVLVGSLFGGLALHTGAATPALKLAGNPGGTPGNYTFTGSNWPSPGSVSFYLDVLNTAHQVARIAVSSNGGFVAGIYIGTADMGPHTMFATDGVNQASVNFTVNSKPPTDPVLADVDSQINNPEYGLQEIKDEVKSMQTDITSLKTSVNAAETSLEDVAKFSGGYDRVSYDTPGARDLVYKDYGDKTVHVSLTLYLKDWFAGDNLWITTYIGGIQDIPLPSIPIWGTAGGLTGVYFFEFDTTSWNMNASVGGNSLTEIAWNYTVISN